MELPTIINYIQTTEAGAFLPKGFIAMAAEGKTPKGWEVVRPLTAEERQIFKDSLMKPSQEHLPEPLCFF